LALVTAALVFAILNWFADSITIRQIETASLDLRFLVRGVSPPGPECAIVLIDDRSTDALGGWPISRSVFAKALAALDQAGAKIVVLDVGFFTPEQPAPSGWQAAVRAATAALSGADNDPLRTSLQRRGLARHLRRRDEVSRS
jgi:adenylate cyclase